MLIMDETCDSVKLCLVCGDKASGVNFNALSCNSCKALFRRNAMNFDDIKCHFNDECKFDLFTRKACKKCRLRKCFSVGMIKEYILNEEARKLRQLKIENNRKKRKNSFNDSLCDSTTGANYAELAEPVQISIRTSVVVINPQPSPPKAKMQFVNNNQANSHNPNAISFDIYKKALEFEFADKPISRSITDSTGRFTDTEIDRISELLSAMNFMNTPVSKITSDCQKDVIRNYQECDTWISLSCGNLHQLLAIYLEQIVQQIVRMSKHLSNFKEICESDQAALIKFSCIEICCLRQFLCFDFEGEYWTLALDTENSVIVKLDMLKQRNTYLNYKTFLSKMASEWDSDSTIVDLITAIVLFNPDCPELIHKDIVRLQQYGYMYLLQRYLIMKYQNDCKAKTKFLRLLNCLPELQILNNKISNNLLKADQENCMPLMGEVCSKISV